MADMEIKTATVENGRSSTSSKPDTEKRWFCIAISPTASIFRRGADSGEGMLETLNNASIGWLDYVAGDFGTEAPAVAKQLGFTDQLVSSLINDPYSTYEDLDVEMGMKMPSIQVRQLEVTAYPFLLLLKKNFIVTIHPSTVVRRFISLRRYSETVLRKLPTDVTPDDKLTLLLMRIIDENNDHNFEHLRQIEERGDDLNESMMDPFVPRTKLGPEIYRMKHALITYLNALWDSMHVLHTLRYGDAELITNDPKLLNRLTVLADDVGRQIELAEHLSEVLASGLEVLQSIYNNQLQNLNNRLALLMTYLTIIGTAVLVPNTLATMLGNSVFEIGPKDLWWYLTLMFGSTAAATGAVYWWVRKQGWIPKKMD